MVKRKGRLTFCVKRKGNVIKFKIIIVIIKSVLEINYLIKMH